jgi:exopolyphosphatase/guanosine-5'-triphosphate,3'-diphosphate pyrophosphatase
MRLAIIDCGTNTFNLLIIEVDPNLKYSKIYNDRISVKLGQGSINHGFIDKEPYSRGIEALKKFKRDIDKYEVTKVLGFATSAIRDAKNGVQFINQIKSETSIEITIIDGEREAELIYLGNKEAVQLTPNTSLIMDIGGGSNEFILANNNGLLWKQSFPIGAARMLEKFNPSDPITSAEISAINNYLAEELEPLIIASKKYKPFELVGSSGAFDSVIDIICDNFNGEPVCESKTCYEINMYSYNNVSRLIINSSYNERKNIKGLVEMRIDMIVISFIMIDFILNSLNLNKMRVSSYSLKEGALIDYIKSSK